MGLFDSMVKSLQGDVELMAISDVQGVAIIDALVAAMFVDGIAEAHELAEFEKQMNGIPWAQRKGDAEKKRLATEAMARVKEASASRTAATWFLTTMAKNLGTQTLREKVYKMAVSICAADRQASPQEQALLGNLANAFGLSEARAKELMQPVLKQLGLA